MRPILQALVLADHVYEDRLSGKKIIAGAFHRVILGQVKTQEIVDGMVKKQVLQGGTDAGSPWVYVSLTDVVAGTELTLQCVNVSKNESLFGTKFRIDQADRLATIEVQLPLPPLRVFATEPGILSLDLVWNGEILGSHRITVTKPEEPAPKSDGS